MKLAIKGTGAKAARRILALACAALVVVGSARAAAPLRWKFKPGEVLHYTMKQKTTNSFKPKTKAAGENPAAEVSTVMTQVVDLHWTVKSVSPRGETSLAQVVDRVRTRIEGAGQPAAFDFDSNAKEEPREGVIAAQLVPLLKTLVGAEFTFKMNPRGELSDIKIPDQVTEAVRKSNPGGGDGVFSDDGLKNLITQSGLGLPEAALENGKTWSQQSKVPLPMMLGTLIMDKSYTLAGPDPTAKGRVEISLDTKVSLQPSAEASVKMKIDRQTGTGVFLFDQERGRVVSSRVEDLLVMSLTARDAPNQEIEQTTKTVTEMKLNPATASKQPGGRRPGSS